VRDEADPYDASIGILQVAIEKLESCYEFAEGYFNWRVDCQQVIDGSAPVAPRGLDQAASWRRGQRVSRRAGRA
jgi:hypothetical protein